MTQEILKMIESVNPSDTAKLDEIDARVWCYKHAGTLGRVNPGAFEFIPVSGAPPFHKAFEPKIRYTRSRDALKAIRPEGWEWYLANYNDGVRFGCAKDSIGTDQMESVSLATEELAELHAIIQAIEWERSQ